MRGGVRTIDAALASGHWRSAVLPDEKLGHGFKQHFTKQGKLASPPPTPETGWPVRLRGVWTYLEGGDDAGSR